MKKKARTGLSLLVLSAGLLSAGAQAQTPGASLMPADKGASVAKHFDPLGKPPSKYTPELRNGIKAQLPLADKRGFIAEPPCTKIMADAGHGAEGAGGRA